MLLITCNLHIFYKGCFLSFKDILSTVATVKATVACYLGIIGHNAEPCYLDAVAYGADLMVQKKDLRPSGVSTLIFGKKRWKLKKNGILMVMKKIVWW